MQEYNYSFLSRTHRPEDVSILASIHKLEDTRMWGSKDTNKRNEPKGMRMWGCKYTSKHTWTWGYEDVRMRGYKLTHMNFRISGCEDARIEANTQEPKDMSMQGCKQGHMNLKIWVCKDARIQASTHKQGYGDARIQASA